MVSSDVVTWVSETEEFSCMDNGPVTPLGFRGREHWSLLFTGADAAVGGA